MNRRLDRTVHALLPDGSVVVRYDRAGKYRVEYPAGTPGVNRTVKLTEAVQLAATGEHLPGKPGGMALDAAVRRELDRRARTRQEGQRG